jgi:hypothetical protein
MPTYTPSFNNPITKSLKVTDSLILSPSATGPFSISNVTDSFTAQSNSSYNWTTTVSSETITLPLTPINGAFVIINDNDWTWGNFPPVVDYNGATTKGAVANASDLSSQVGGEIKFIYNSSLNEWTSYLKPVSTDDPFHGWWRKVTKTGLSSGATDAEALENAPFPSGYNPTKPDELQSVYGDLSNVNYYYLDTISMYPNIKVTSYGGTYDNIFQSLYFESVYERMVDDPNTLSYPGLPGTPSFSYETYNSIPFTSPNTLTLQSNKTQIFAGGATDPKFILTPVYNAFGTSVLEKMSEPPVTIRPYSDNEVSYPDVQDPVFMFKYYADLFNKRRNVGNGSQEANDEWYIGYYNQQKILNEYLQGKTIEYPINHIVKSTTVQNQEYYNAAYGELVGATKIYLAEEHLITKGSTISITGFTDVDWTTINGDYTNDVIFDTHFKNANSGHFDLDETSKSGSFYNTTQYFVMKLDTSSLTGIQTGAYKGWALYEGTPSVSVTHKITSDMSYNNWVAALKSYLLEVYGPSSNVSIPSLYSANYDGRLIDSFNETDVNAVVPPFTFDVSSISLGNWAAGYAGGPSNLINSKYRLGQVFTSMYQYADHYDVMQTIADYYTGALAGGYSITALNYLDPDERYNLYYGFKGSFTTGAEGSVELVQGIYQREIGQTYGLMNLEIAGQTGGSILVYTGAKFDGFNEDPTVDLTKWRLYGRGITAEITRRMLYNLIYGLMSSDLTNGKKIGYLYIPNFEAYWFNSIFFYSNAGAFWNVWSDPSVLQNAPDKFLNGVIAVAMVPVMQYFNQQNVDAVILDVRGSSSASLDSDWVAQFFGGDRLKINRNTFFMNTQNQKGAILNTTDYEYYLGLNATGSDNYLHPSFLESAQGYGTGSVYHGSNQTGAKVLLLASESVYGTSSNITWNMVGDNLDGQIGQNTSVKILGCNRSYADGPSFGRAQLPYPYIESSLRGLPIQYTSVDPGSYLLNIKLYTGTSGAINLVSTSAITDYNSISEMTTSTGSYPNALGNPLPMDLETRVYPDYGFVENTKPRLPGDTRPQQPDPTLSGTWRDGWIEAAIGETVYGSW